MQPVKSRRLVISAGAHELLSTGRIARQSLGCLALLFLFSCGGAKIADTESPEGSWVLIRLEEELLEDAENHPLLSIDPGANRYSGNDGCNQYTGQMARLEGPELVFGIAAGTRMACPDMQIADRYNHLLQDCRSYRIKAGKLHLYSEEGKELLVFRPADD